MMFLFQVSGVVSCCENVKRFGSWACLHCCREASSARSNCCCFGGIPSLKLHATSFHFVFSTPPLKCLNLHPFFSGLLSISFWSVDSSWSSRWIHFLLLKFLYFCLLLLFSWCFQNLFGFVQWWRVGEVSNNSNTAPDWFKTVSNMDHLI